MATALAENSDDNNNNQLLVFIFAIKLLSQTPLFTYIREKTGISTQRQCRAYERLCIRREKCSDDIKFLLTCKIEGLLPRFAKPKLSILNNQKLNRHIALLIIKTEQTSIKKTVKKRATRIY